jgi:hypothetical protein
MKENQLQLRPAADLTREVQEETKKRNEKYHKRLRAEVADEIEKNKRKGQVTFLSLPDWICEELKDLGYKIEDYKAAGMGDMASTEVTWKI